MDRGVSARLPIDALKGDLREALAAGPVVISAPTGSGKSTQVPRWCPGPVLVVEPRRVACRTLAARVAELEGTRLGERVGYHVRDDVRRGPETEVVFATPGIALLELADRGLDGYGTVILDEFHERTLDVDLLFALLRSRKKPLVVMSATLEADRIAEALGGRHLRAEGRTFEVDVTYDLDGPTFPTARHLTDRVARAVKRRADQEGDVLVFLPGKGEIGAAKAALSSLPGREVLELHGGLTPQQQAAAFRTGGKPKVILSTNVAETSVTVPGVKLVVDSGLVRQTRYHAGRGALSLVAIAMDSAEQRRGRAGRVSAGACLRLWGPGAQLKDRTLPEVHRESLVPLVLAARACGADPASLGFLDPPRDHALEAAIEELTALGALDPAGALTDRGRRLFRLPLDPWLGRLLVEAEGEGALDDAIDLVSVLAVGRPPFEDAPAPPEEHDPRSAGCDVAAFVDGFRQGGLRGGVLAEANGYRSRLRRALGLEDRAAKGRCDRRRLVRVALAADPRAAYIARRRKRHVAWANGGTEIELDRRSALELVTHDGLTKLPDAMAVFGIRALSDGPSTRIIATCASPLTLADLNAAGLGRPRLGPVRMERRRVVADVEHVFAGKVLRTEQTRPKGALLREAVVALTARNTIFKGAAREVKDRLQMVALARRLAQVGLLETYPGDLEPFEGLSTDVEAHLAAALERLGLEAPEDLELLEAEDLLPPELPAHLAERIEREYPRTVTLGDATYRVEYETGARKAILHMVKGHRKTAPPRQYLPRFPGFRLVVQAGGTFHEV